MGEIGALETVFWCWCFLMASSDLPRRASCSLANLALRRLCSGVWAWVLGGFVLATIAHCVESHAGKERSQDR